MKNLPNLTFVINLIADVPQHTSQMTEWENCPDEQTETDPHRDQLSAPTRLFLCVSWLQIQCSRMPRPLSRLLLLCVGISMTCISTRLHAQDDDIHNEYRITMFPSHRISNTLTGFAYLGFVTNPDKDYNTYYFGWPGITYSPKSWLQIWGGLVMLYTDNQEISDKFELRPFAGLKTFLPNSWHWNIYNFTRYELRAVEDIDSRDWNTFGRLRSRFGLEFPLSTKKAWQPNSFYALADAEPYYRFDSGVVDLFRIRGGVAYITNFRVRFELIYHAQFTRPTGVDHLDYTDNIFRLNIKIGLHNGILATHYNPREGDQD